MEFLASEWVGDHQVCCAEPGLVHCPVGLSNYIQIASDNHSRNMILPIMSV